MHICQIVSLIFIIFASDLELDLQHNYKEKKVVKQVKHEVKYKPFQHGMYLGLIMPGWYYGHFGVYIDKTWELYLLMMPFWKDYVIENHI